jgi:hypothetical protein
MGNIPRGEVLDTLILYREVITPEIASEMKKHANPKNRKISPATIKTYATDMEAGNWDPDPVNPIVFDKSGIMRDGHHRIDSIILANKAIITYVAEEADMSNTYDIGRMRTVDNVLSMEGVDVNSTVTSIIRSVGKYVFGVPKASIGEIRTAYKTDGDGIQAILKATRGGNQNPIMKVSYVVAALYCAYKCGVSIDDIARFSNVVNSGIQENGNQSAAVVLRNQLLNSKVSANGTIRRDIRKSLFLCTQEALKDFIDETRRTRAYTGKGAIYSTRFADMFRNGTLFKQG